MAVTKRIEIGQRIILPDGEIMVRTDTVIEDDGVEIARTYHREVLVPGDDFAGRDASIVRVAAVEHTAARIAAYRAKVAAREV